MALERVPVGSGGGHAAPEHKDCHPGDPACGPASLVGKREGVISRDSTANCRGPRLPWEGGVPKRKECAPHSYHSPSPGAPHTVHAVLVVLVEVLIRVPAHGRLCGVVVHRD